MRKAIFAASPGLVFASASLFSSGQRLEELEQGKLEREQRLVVFATGSPSLDYDLDIVEENNPELPGGGVEFGLHTAGGLIVLDGYPFVPEEAPQRSFVLELPDGYYRVRAQALPTILDHQMRLRLSVRPSALELSNHPVDLDFAPPPGTP